MQDTEIPRFKAVGIVHRKESDDEVRKGLSDSSESEVEIYPQYKDAVEGLDGFSHIFVLAYFHNLRPEQIGPLKVRPKRLAKFGLKLEEIPFVGDFTLDSPTRPNPIGLSLVRLLRIVDGRKLVVSELEFFDGTPVLDIKPYQAGYRVEEYLLPKWNTDLAMKAGLSPSESI
ncbi:MAG: tRNA (N6-threonylcarbamoyladenosine(37)-N6)-methyltransferase TrmO [Nitrososphaerota archaeon]|nr:tRNA (N6-threonylcarbamoyladenosine(37)-N6)-methyltransferase TrmO [Nitrososphaerota archaeon]